MQGSRARKRACWDLTGRPVWMEGSRGPDHGGPCRQWSGLEFIPATVGRLWRAPEALGLTHRLLPSQGADGRTRRAAEALSQVGPRAPATCPPGHSPASPGRPAACAGLSYCSFTFTSSSSSCACEGYSCPEKKVNYPYLTAYRKPQLMFGIRSDFFQRIFLPIWPFKTWAPI